MTNGEQPQAPAKPVAAAPVQTEKKVPAGVKVISVLYYIGAVLSILFGLFFIIFGAGFTQAFADLGMATAGLGAYFIIIAIIIIALGILGIFIGRGLWKGQGWARILAIIFAILGFLGAIGSIIMGSFASIINLIIQGWIGGYLLFSKKVKAAFAKTPAQ
jgi:hypothetical protein